MSKRNEEKWAYWRSVLDRQRASGLSVRQFCKESQVAEASFHTWKRKIARGDCQESDSSEKVGQERSKAKRVARQTESSEVFIPVRVSAAASSVLEVVHPRGHVLRVPAVFDEGSLRVSDPTVASCTA
jgi:hypothetical protein